jgi:peptide-methionine (S)-S-oxide reductase
MQDISNTDYIILGGGCFWCLEPIFQQLNGVIEVENAYCGGHFPNPTYKDICSGTSGHAEVVKVTFRPDIISLDTLLQIFFTFHDPTTLNQQGNDRGTQYRSAIFFNSAHQESEAKRTIQEFAPRIWNSPIVTVCEPEYNYYPAEAYHQDYYNQNPHQAYCAYHITPKLLKFKKMYQNILKEPVIKGNSGPDAVS